MSARRLAGRVTALLLCLAVIAAQLVSPAMARETHFFSAWPETVSLDTLTYGPADAAAFYELLDQLEEASAAEGALPQIAALLSAVNEAWLDLYTQYTLCMLDYYRDPSAAGEAYAAWSQTINQAMSAYMETERCLLQSQYGPVIAQAWGSDVDTLLAQLTPDSPEQQALLAQDQALVSAYWTAVNGEYTVAYQGQQWTQAALDEDQGLSAGAASEIQRLLDQAVNAHTAPILVELVEVRNQYAQSKGYDNYAQYAYQAEYARDYTLDQAQILYEQVKAEIAPLLQEMYLPLVYNGALDAALLEPYTSGLTQEEMLDLVEPYMDAISSEYAALFRYMRQGNLADIGPSDTKLGVGFTTGLPAYRSAVMFNCPDGSYYDIETLTHEFGHYAEYCLSAEEGDGGDCIDVAEMNSQMLELLFLEFADDMFAEGGDAYRALVLYQVASSVVTGCYFDELQAAIYTDGAMTAEEINALAGALAEEYGVDTLFGGDPADTWVQVSHTFESPMYYISYATSALSALELFLRAEEDFEGAADTYLAMVARGTGMGYREAVAQAGLTDYFQPGTMAQLADGLRGYLQAEVYDLPAFADLEGHWAQADALLCAGAGLFEGDSSGSFLPDGQMTRAQLATLLWRMAGCPEGTGESAFSDVAEDAWYAQAVAWAAEAGIVTGVGGGRFDPEGTVTREQLAVMICRDVMGEAAAGSDAADTFADSDQISGWARGSVGWAVYFGLLTGKPGNLLDPQGAVTRAEAAALLARLMSGQRA